MKIKRQPQAGPLNPLAILLAAGLFCSGAGAAGKTDSTPVAATTEVNRTALPDMTRIAAQFAPTVVNISVHGTHKVSTASDASAEDGKIGVGVQEVDQTLAQAFKLDKTAGALVTDIAPGGAAARAGLQSGDLLLAINGRAVSTVKPASDAADRDNKSLALLVQREGTRIYVPVRLSMPPN